MRTLIKLANVSYKERNEIYGEYITKEAMDASIVVPAIVSSLLGGITAHKAAESHTMKAMQQNMKSPLEGNDYQDIKNIFKDMTVTFTPINVIYNLNGKAFEIINTKEMNDEMLMEFRKKNSDYFAQLLANKMSIEMQMAERYFARQLLGPAIAKDESILTKMANHNVAESLEYRLERIANSGKHNDDMIKVAMNLDLFRPFKKNEELTNADVEVADTTTATEVLTTEDFDKNLRILFLADRVVFMHNELLVEQIGVMSMNELGYEAFKNKNKDFFKNVFLKEVDVIQDAIHKTASVNKTFLPTVIDNEEGFYKEAASVSELVARDGWIETTMFDRDTFDIFRDNETHPVLYDMYLDDRYGANWHEHEAESLLKAIENDFLNGGEIDDIVLNKILALQNVQNESTSMFDTAFTFEKFVRALNGKRVDLTIVELDLDFGEILFALDIAESICSYNIYDKMAEQVCIYIANTLFENGVRLVSTSLYETEDNEEKHIFFETVNGHLLRKWKDRDSTGLFGEESTNQRNVTEFINEAADIILEEKAQLLDINRPYTSANTVVSAYFEKRLDAYDEKETIISTIAKIIQDNLMVAMMLEFKKEEASYVIEKIK